MPSRDKPPFRADHVGSLLRPPELARARADFKAGTDRRARRCATTEDEAIRGVIELQRAAGLRTRHRRRVSPDLVAHGLHLLAGRDRAGRGRVDPRAVPQRRRASTTTPRRRCA